MEKPVAMGEVFCSYAKAKDGKTFIGAQETYRGKYPWEARWFAFEVTRRDFPWVFAKAGDPQRVIAALEMMGSVLSLMYFTDRLPPGSGSCKVTGVTDNRGNSFIIKKMMSTKFPLPVLLMELAEQMKHRHLSLELEWTPREDNTEADALSNFEVSQFDPDKRIRIDPSDIPWMILPQFVEESANLFAELQADSTRRKRKQSDLWPGAKKRLRLKATDPWR